LCTLNFANTDHKNELFEYVFFVFFSKTLKNLTITKLFYRNLTPKPGPTNVNTSSGESDENLDRLKNCLESWIKEIQKKINGYFSKKKKIQYF
jgi:hypothetical protein